MNHLNDTSQTKDRKLSGKPDKVKKGLPSIGELASVLYTCKFRLANIFCLVEIHTDKKV